MAHLHMCVVHLSSAHDDLEQLVRLALVSSLNRSIDFACVLACLLYCCVLYVR